MHPNFSSFSKFFSNPERGINFISELLLLVSFYVANYHLSVLYALFTDVWKLKLYDAVILTNIQDGSKSVFPILVACLADTCLGDSFMLLLSALLYFMGLLILYLIFPIGEENDRGFTTLDVFFYLSLVLITVGQCGYVKYNGDGDEERRIQDRAVSDHEDERRGGNEIQDTSKDDRTRSRLWIYTHKIFTRLWSEIIYFRIVIVGMPIAIFLIPGGRPEFLCLAVLLISTSAVFFIGKVYYRSFTKPQTSSLVQVFRVCLAAFNKRHYDSKGTSRYYGDADSTPQPELKNSDTSRDDSRVDHDIDNNNSEPKLRFLDKATLYNPSTENADTEFDNHRLFKVSQVNDTRRFFKAIRLSSIFLLYGVLTSVGDTFFTGQANNMDAQVYSFEIPIEVITYSPRVTQELVSRLCRWVRKKHVKGPYYPFYGAARVGLAMLLSVPCFVVAFLVEAKRLKAINTDSNISVFWLMPQLFLLGAMDGLAKTGIEDFFEQEMPKPISSSYGNLFSEGVVGVGQLLGCLWFVCWYSVSKIDGSSGWFGDDIDGSHLDRYYLVMAGFGFISCIICGIVSARRYLRKSQGFPETPAPRSDKVVQSTESNLINRPLPASMSFSRRSKESNSGPLVYEMKALPVTPSNSGNSSFQVMVDK
ncbi:protein NRT1/ PTR FAMILY 5.5-like [Silene latifolia]|uniref:protein NRT1/ PTR FAMILY 5.5-like n=1 Tax=Silene latifolia TaxID=37657 RepID=UPI003D7837B3